LLYRIYQKSGLWYIAGLEGWYAETTIGHCGAVGVGGRVRRLGDGRHRNLLGDDLGADDHDFDAGHEHDDANNDDADDADDDDADDGVGHDDDARSDDRHDGGSDDRLEHRR